MHPLQLDPAALHLLASRCREWSAGLAVPSGPVSHGSIPATRDAITAVHSALCDVAEILAERMGKTAALLDETAHRFESGESDSATTLSGLAAQQ